MRKLPLYAFSAISRRLGATVNNNVEIKNKFITGTTGPNMIRKFYCVKPEVKPKGTFRGRLEFESYETVPYTKRTRFIAMSIDLERDIGLKAFQEFKQIFSGRNNLDDPTHPHSVRVTKVFNNIINALHREMNKMRSASDYTILHRLWLRLIRRSPPSLSHLDGLNWEVYIINHPSKLYAESFSGGKFTISTGLIEHHACDAQLAMILAHEVAHIVARHGAEGFEDPQNISRKRRFEFEADYIGLLLMASAGYDPRLAPKAYEGMGELQDSIPVGSVSAYPTERERIKALLRHKIMEEALTLYNDARARLGIE